MRLRRSEDVLLGRPWVPLGTASRRGPRPARADQLAPTGWGSRPWTARSRPARTRGLAGRARAPSDPSNVGSIASSAAARWPDPSRARAAELRGCAAPALKAAPAARGRAPGQPPAAADTGPRARALSPRPPGPGSYAQTRAVAAARGTAIARSAGRGVLATPRAGGTPRLRTSPGRGGACWHCWEAAVARCVSSAGSRARRPGGIVRSPPGGLKAVCGAIDDCRPIPAAPR